MPSSLLDEVKIRAQKTIAGIGSALKAAMMAALFGPNQMPLSKDTSKKDIANAGSKDSPSMSERMSAVQKASYEIEAQKRIEEVEIKRVQNQMGNTNPDFTRSILNISSDPFGKQELEAKPFSPSHASEQFINAEPTSEETEKVAKERPKPDTPKHT